MSRTTLLRTSAVLAVTGAVVLAGPSSAAPAVCNLIKDEAGDGGVVTFTDDVDILTGDLVSNDKTITAVLRLAGEPDGLNPEALGGKNFYVSFQAPGSTDPQYLAAAFDATGAASYSTGVTTTDTDGLSTNTDDAEPAKGKVEGNDITITAPLSAFSSRVNLKPGADKRLTGLTAEVYGLVGVLLVPADDATGGSYTLGAASCAKGI